MSKITLNSIAPSLSFTTAVNNINNNSATITTAIDNTLSRDGTTPNQMLSELDMNSNQIINLPAPSTPESPVRLVDLTDLTDIVVPTLTFDTKQLFQAQTNISDAIVYVSVNAVTGTYPSAAGLDATHLTYRRVSTTTGLFGEITVAGQLWAPIYSTNPVNAGQFGVVPDASYTESAAYITATANGTTTLTTASTAGLVVGMNIANLSWHSFGANRVPAGTTVVSFVPNTSILVSNIVPAGSNLLLLAWKETMAGTDNTVALQATIDFAIQNKYPDVKIPNGRYMISNTLNIGWGDTFREIHLRGAERASYAGALPGVTIYCSHTNSPGISVQGSRSCSIQGITLIGRYRNWAQFAQWFSHWLSSDPLDWVPPQYNPSGSNPGGLQQHSPYAGITQDAYSGTQPTDHYPDRVYPAYVIAGGYSTQYNGALGSDILVQDCVIEGFGVQIVSGLNTSNQGDFLKMNRVNLDSGPYGVSVNNTQSRNVEFRNISYAGFHTLFSGTNLGLATGEIIGPLDNISGGGSYQAFDFQGLGFSGPLIITNFYCEDQVRIGNFVAAQAFAANVTIRGGNFTLATQFDWMPDSYITSGGSGVITLENVDIVGGTRIGNMVRGGGTLIVNGGSWVANTVAPAVTGTQLAVNYCGGILAGDCRFNASNLRGYEVRNLKGMYYATVSGSEGAQAHDITAKFTNSNGTLTRVPMQQGISKYVDQAKRQWNMSITPENSFTTSFTSAGFTITNDSLTFGYLQAFQEHTDNMYHMAVGDIIYHLPTWTIFAITVVGALSGGNYPITAIQQNNIRTDDSSVFISNQISDPTLAGNLILIKTGARIPSTLNYASYTSGSTSLTAITTGAASTMTNFIVNGDVFFGLGQSIASGMPYRKWPIATGTTISSVNDGAATATLSVNALASGTFPLFPYELY